MMGDPGTSDTMLPHPTFGIPRKHEFQGQAPSSAFEPSAPSFSNSLHRQSPPFFQPLHRPTESFRQDGCEEWSNRDSQLGAGSPTGLRDCTEDQVPGLFCPSEDTRDVMTRARVGEDDLFTFPEGEHDAVTMTARDLASLQPGKFLTDNTIDFYIRYLKEKLVSPQNQNEFHFFNSFFFTKLLEKSSSTGIDECKVDYEQLRMWTAGVNLFEKDYVFIPIVESSHWSLIVLCHLKSLSPTSYVDRKGRPCILHLDPTEGKHEHFEGQVRSYILQAWAERIVALDNMDILHSLVQMKYVQAKVPQQDNNYDCSLYVLHYIEVFLSKSMSQDLSFLSSERGANFTTQNFKMEVFDKRNHIQGLIFKLGGMVQVQDGNLSNTQDKHQDKVGSTNSLRCKHQNSCKLVKQTKNKKWKEIETSILLQCMVDGDHFCNGKLGAMHWDLIVEAINLKSNGETFRSKEQCQNRFDTLLKAYKELNAYCEQTGKNFHEVTDEEKRVLKLATPLEKKNEGWYNNLHTIYCWRSSLRCKGGKRQKLNLHVDIEKSKLTSSPFKSPGECSAPLNIIRSSEPKKHAAFVKAQDHQLPSFTHMPSSAWIPEYRSHNTSTDKVTSFEPRDINSGKNYTSDNINNIHVAASVQFDEHKSKQTSLELQWMSVGVVPPLLESGRDLETNLDLQLSTSYGSDVLRETVGNFPDDNLWLHNQSLRQNLDFKDLTCAGFEVTPAETSFPTSDDNGCNEHRWSDARTNPRICIPANNKPQTPPQTPLRSGRKYKGVTCYRKSKKWTAEFRVRKWKALGKVWLGTFNTEQAAARAFDLVRKLLKCKEKYPFNLPCEKLEAYSTTIPEHLFLADLTTASTFEVRSFIMRECHGYVALFDDTPSEQIPTVEQHSSSGGQFLSPTYSINQAAQWFENMFPSTSPDSLDVDDNSDWDVILDMTLVPL